MTTGERMKARRKELDLSAERIAEALGVSPATIYRYEKGDIEKVSSDILPKLAKILRTSPAYLMGWEDSASTEIPEGFQPMPAMTAVPRVGRIACGEPITAEQNIEGEDEVPAAWGADFTLVCQGDSMLPKIQDGDVVAIRAQPDIENGEIAAVRIDDEATLKKVYVFPDHVYLQPINTDFAPIIISGEQLETLHIEGKAVGLLRKF